MVAANRGTHSSDSWQYVAANGETSLSKTSRAIRIGGAGDLYAHIGDAAAETQVGVGFTVGEIVYVQTDKIGTSTTTTNMTVYHN